MVAIVIAMGALGLSELSVGAAVRDRTKAAFRVGIRDVGRLVDGSALRREPYGPGTNRISHGNGPGPRGVTPELLVCGSAPTRVSERPPMQYRPLVTDALGPGCTSEHFAFGAKEPLA